MYLQSWRRTNPKKRNHHDLGCILKGDLKRAVRKVKMSGQKSCESSSPKWLEAEKLNWALMSGQKSSQGSERPSWDGRYLANFKNRFPAYIESGFIAMWGKGEHHAVQPVRDMTSRFRARLRIWRHNVEEVNKKLRREFIPVNAAERVNNEKVLLERRPSEWTRDLACQVINIVTMPANLIMLAK